MATQTSTLESTGRSLVPSDRTRAAIAKRLAGATAQMTTSTLAAMEQRHPWFSELDADHRSWITLVARSGIDGFVNWFADDPKDPFDPAMVFGSAPRSITRQISLHHTVDLMRTTISVVEEQLDHLLPRSDRPILRTAIVHYSREIAFAAAEVYARAAEVRGAWDARLEALVVDAIVRAETDETVVSRASTLGWRSGTRVCVAVGYAAADPQAQMTELRRRAEKLGVDFLISTQGDRLVVVIGSEKLATGHDAEEFVKTIANHFSSGPIVVGPLVDDLVNASVSARAAISGLRAAQAWPEGEHVLSSQDLLPERALAGDGHARRTLSIEIFKPLEDAGGDLLPTCVSFLDHGCSVEATARALYVHANTVRYRLKRIQDVTGYSPNDARDAYVLRLAITLGRLAAR